MNNVLTLIKYDILGAFNKFTKNKKTILMAVFIIILCTFAFSFTFLQQSIQLLEILNGTGYEAYALVNPVMMYCSMTLIFIISQSIITTETNTDFLLSLPIKKTSIICAKTITTTFLHFVLD